VVWLDGRLLDARQPVLRIDDSAWLEGRGAYTSARIDAGHARFAARHATRLARSARALGIGEIDPALVLRAFDELGRAAFGDGAGVVRLQASRDAHGDPHLVGVPRALGEDRESWSALVVRLPGPTGAAASAGAKVSSRLAIALASDAAARAGADEALLVDAAGRLVEGARTNAIVVDADGRLSTPPLALGAVAGIAREVLLERVPELGERVVLEPELRGAREIIAVNAVRGARAVVRVDDFSVGDGAPGPWARLLDAELEGA
jgi:branched-subunit amino acid aminotransferase/4-amino-4-deoxychorismate lyase